MREMRKNRKKSGSSEVFSSFSIHPTNFTLGRLLIRLFWPLWSSNITCIRVGRAIKRSEGFKGLLRTTTRAPLSRCWVTTPSLLIDHLPVQFKPLEQSCRSLQLAATASNDFVFLYYYNINIPCRCRVSLYEQINGKNINSPRQLCKMTAEFRPKIRLSPWSAKHPMPPQLSLLCRSAFTIPSSRLLVVSLSYKKETARASV